MRLSAQKPLLVNNFEVVHKHMHPLPPDPRQGMIPLDPRLLGESLLFLCILDGREYPSLPPAGDKTGVQGTKPLGGGLSGAQYPPHNPLGYLLVQYAIHDQLPKLRRQAGEVCAEAGYADDKIRIEARIFVRLSHCIGIDDVHVD